MVKTFKKLNRFNEDHEFIAFRESNAMISILVCSLIGFFAFPTFHILDIAIGLQNLSTLLSLRIGTAVNLLFVAGLAYYLPKKRQFFYPLLYYFFYSMTLFGALITLNAGGFNSSYWVILIYIFVAWFGFMPIGFKKLVQHGMGLLVFNSATIYFLSHDGFSFKTFFPFNFYLIAFFLIAGIIAYFNNLQKLNLFEMQKDLQQEKEHSERLLLNILPKSISEKLKSTKDLIASSHEDVSVLFADLVGFTSLSKSMDAQDLVKLLNDIFTVFDKLALKYGLEKIKTIGDSYMVIGGAPDLQNNHIDNIFYFAKDIIKEINNMNDQNNQQLMIRIGIHNGPVVAGVIGHTKFTYDLWGNTVNIASRMESSGLPNKIQVSEFFFDALNEKSGFSKRDMISVKGLGQMNTYIYDPW